MDDYSENDYYNDGPKFDYYNMKNKKYNNYQNFTIFQEEEYKEYKEYENFEDVIDDYSINKNINKTTFIFPFICVLSLSPFLFYLYKIKK